MSIANPKPHRIIVKPRSERQKKRLACLLAFEALSWVDQQALVSKASRLLDLIAETRTP